MPPKPRSCKEHTWYEIRQILGQKIKITSYIWLYNFLNQNLAFSTACPAVNSNGPTQHLSVLKCNQKLNSLSKQTECPSHSKIAVDVSYRLFVCLGFNGTFSINRLYRTITVGNISRRGRRQHKYIIKQWSNTINQENHAHSSAWAFWRRSPRHD